VTEGQPAPPHTQLFSPNTSGQNFEQAILISIVERVGGGVFEILCKKFQEHLGEEFREN
jgi:hypothetical protein